DAGRVPLPPRPAEGEGVGSIVVVVGTAAPLLPHHCERLAGGAALGGACERVAVRALLGAARVGGAGEKSSGDFALSFSTGQTQSVEPVPNDGMNPLFYAAIEATEEAIVNALLAAETMTGRGGATAYGLEAELLTEAMSTR